MHAGWWLQLCQRQMIQVKGVWAPAPPQRDSKGRTSVVGDMRPVCDDDRAVRGGSRPPGDSSTLLGMLLVTDGGVAPRAPIDPAGPAPDSMVSAYSQLGSQHSTGQIPKSTTQYYCARMPQQPCQEPYECSALRLACGTMPASDTYAVQAMMFCRECVCSED